MGYGQGMEVGNNNRLLQEQARNRQMQQQQQPQSSAMPELANALVKMYQNSQESPAIAPESVQRPANQIPMDNGGYGAMPQQPEVSGYEKYINDMFKNNLGGG